MIGANLLRFSIGILACYSSLLWVNAEDPYRYYTWTITYGTISPLGVPQQVSFFFFHLYFSLWNFSDQIKNLIILLCRASLSMDNSLAHQLKLSLMTTLLLMSLISWTNLSSLHGLWIVIFSYLITLSKHDILANEIYMAQNFLIRNGIKQRKTSWQDGVLGTNCPVLPRTNWTYKFQLKDQVGTFTYFASTSMHRAAGAFGAFNVAARSVIPIPYRIPIGDFTILISDWYKAGHKVWKQYQCTSLIICNITDH